MNKTRFKIQTFRKFYSTYKKQSWAYSTPCLEKNWTLDWEIWW